MTSLYHYRYSPQGIAVRNREKAPHPHRPSGKTVIDCVRTRRCPFCGQPDGMGYVDKFMSLTPPLPGPLYLDGDGYLRCECGYCVPDTSGYELVEAFGQLETEAI